jgi:UDP:flavonoid glycosyltransferase YjiC (YdhE family)
MKILVIPYTHTLSHVSRPLAVSLELRRRGHEVLFAGESPKKDIIEREGFTVLPLHEPDPEVLYGNIRSGTLRFVSDTEITLMLEADLDLYQQVKPDLVLTDGRFTAPISTHIAGIKHAAIVNVSSTEYRALPYIPFFYWLPEWLFKRDSMLWGGLDRFNLWLEMLVFDRAMNAFTRLSKKHGLPKQITATNCLVGKDLTLLADIPEYFPTKNLPDNYCYVGPLTWKSALPPPDWWPPRLDGKPLIYFTLGTTGLREFFHSAAALFQSAGLPVVMSTGDQTKDLVSREGALYVEPFLDGDLLSGMCDVVVCHGGNGTIYQALSHGKPVVGIPTIPDQEFNMRRVEALAVGRTVTWAEYDKNPQALLDAVKDLLRDPSYRKNAVHMQTIIKSYDPCNTAADCIERLGCNNG